MYSPSPQGGGLFSGNVAVGNNKQIAIFLWENARLYGNI